MNRLTQIPVSDPDGVEGVVITTSRFLDDDREKLVRLKDGSEFFVPVEKLRRTQDGTYELTVSSAAILQAGRPAEPRLATSGETIVPVIEEQLRVETRDVETGRIRVSKRVETSETVVDEPLFEEGYDIERVPANRVLKSPAEPRYEGDTLVLPVVEEVLVVEKRLVLREELRITRKRREIHDPQTHTVRREHIDVERVR